MNIKKINTFVLKEFHKENTRIFFGEYDERIGICDGVILLLMDPGNFPFNTEVFPNRNDVNDFDKIIGNVSDYIDGRKTGAIREVLTGQAVEIKRGDIEVWVNSDFLKYFDKDCTFKIKRYNCPVLVYESDKLAGMIMPVRVKNEEV